MRTILDSELLTIRETQKLLNLTRCEIMDMIHTGRLETINTGSQLRIEGRIIKCFLACSCHYEDEEVFCPRDFGENVSDYEMEMISEWT